LDDERNQTMTNTPERYDHHEDGMEVAKDGDFVSYEDCAAEFARAEQAEARVKELEEILRLADAALGGANMNMPVIERKIKAVMGEDK
jgi:hypothetical protein